MKDKNKRKRKKNTKWWPGKYKGLKNSQEYCEWRTAVLEKNAHTCVQCGSTEKLHAHHLESQILYPSMALDVDNGISLCIPCHRDLHKNDQPLKTPYERYSKETKTVAVDK